MAREIIRVLLIEDDPDDAMLIRLMLAEENEISFQCEHAGDLASGLERLGEYRADVVLLDLGLPDSTGIDTVVQMRRQAPEVPIVVLTGQYDRELGIQAIGKGAQDYLIKGKTRRTLLVRTLRYALQRHRLQAELKEQAEAIAASEARLRSIVDKNVDAIVGVGSDGNLRFVSRAAERLLGRPAKELIGTLFGFPIATDRIVELVIEQPNGEARVVEMDVVEVDWEGESVRLASLRDVTQRKQAEEALSKSERQLRIRNRISEIFLTVPDEQMYGEVLQTVLEISGSRHGVFGYLREDGALACPSLTGDIWDQCRLPDKDIVFPPESWGGLWGRALAEKRTCYANEPAKVPEGHLPVNQAVALPVVHEDRVLGLLMVGNKDADYDAHDIELLETISNHIAPVLDARLERDKHERQRAAAQRDWEQIFQSLGHPTMILDLQRRVLDANPALLRAAGLTRTEILGKTCYDVCHGEDLAPDNCPLAEAIEAGRTASAEIHCQGLEGTYLVSCSPMFDEAGQVDRIIHIGWNITEHKQAQKAIRRFEGEFSAARRVQEALLPSEAPVVPGLDIAGFNTPATFTAGDYYGYFPMSHGRLGVVVADVMGHGLGPSLVTAEIRAYLRSLTQEELTVEELLSRLNRLVWEDLPTGDFLTLFFAVLDHQRRRLTYASAGQPGFLVQPSGEHLMLGSTSLPLGVLENPNASSAATFGLEPGQIILLPTDGIYESPSREGGVFGRERMIEVIHRCRDRNACDMVACLEETVFDHLEGNPPRDDLTAVVIKVLEL
jgi:PAS domain S-box-containing protein